MGLHLLRPSMFSGGSSTGTMFSTTPTVDGVNYYAYTHVIRFATAALTLPPGSISSIRITLRAHASIGMTIENSHVQHQAAAGDLYDFSTTPIQILWGGAATKLIAAGTEETSDWTTFAYNKTDPLLFSWHLANNGAGSAKENSAISNVNSYRKLADEPATVDKTGYTAEGGVCRAVVKIEADGF